MMIKKWLFWSVCLLGSIGLLNASNLTQKMGDYDYFVTPEEFFDAAGGLPVAQKDLFGSQTLSLAAVYGILYALNQSTFGLFSKKGAEFPEINGSSFLEAFDIGAPFNIGDPAHSKSTAYMVINSLVQPEQLIWLMGTGWKMGEPFPEAGKKRVNDYLNLVGRYMVVRRGKLSYAGYTLLVLPTEEELLALVTKESVGPKFPSPDKSLFYALPVTPVKVNNKIAEEKKKKEFEDKNLKEAQEKKQQEEEKKKQLEQDKKKNVSDKEHEEEDLKKDLESLAQTLEALG